jgi:hypothetical protein
LLEDQDEFNPDKPPSTSEEFNPDKPPSASETPFDGNNYASQQPNYGAP